MDKKIFRDISYGIYLVTSSLEEKNVGCVINTLTQLTSTDPIISICLNKDNYTNQMIKQRKFFAVSIISEDTPKEIIGKFGYQTSKETDKFESTEYEIIENLPVVKENTCGYIIAEVLDIVDCNTHDLFIAKVIDTKKENNNTPMTYKYYHENLKGTSPKNAPTYEEPPKEETNTTSSKYRCTICGYIYDDAKEQIKFEDLPEDWKCPLCGAPKSAFEKITE